MKKHRISTLVLIAGMLLTLVYMGGCVPSEEGEEAGFSIVPLIIILVLIFGMFYLFMIRPMRQREKKHDAIVEELQRGDMVITAGGIHGRVESISDDSVVLRVESGATIRVTKGGILSRQEK